MIYDEDPLRRRPRESTARRLRHERCVWMARETTKWPSTRWPITKIMSSDGCNGNRVPLEMGPWYDFREFGCHLGNVGYSAQVPIPTKPVAAKAWSPSENCFTSSPTNSMTPDSSIPSIVILDGLLSPTYTGMGSEYHERPVRPRISQSPDVTVVVCMVH